jgi:NAD(P)-dependent dehydrogenase (short-subunit alcohol dehydrogenase family)
MKRALITGANKGIGLETARQLGRQGIEILLGSRDLARGEQAALSLREDGITVHVIQLDMEDAASIGEAASRIKSEFGSLDILVNNAGVWLEGQEMGVSTVASISQDDLMRTYQVNLFGVVDLTQRLLPLLKASPAGRIVNLSSILASLNLQADPKAETYGVKVFAYNSSKAALNSFTIHLAYELRDTNVKVNSAHPGWVLTDLGGPNAPMNVEQGAKTSVWLATLPEDGPTGGYFHMERSLPW